MKIHLLNGFFGAIILAAGLTALAEENAIKPLNKKEYDSHISNFDKGRDCVFSRTIGNWAMLDNQRLILYAPTKSKPYYVKLSIRSHELKYVNAIAVHSKFDNRFCPYGGNALFIDGSRYTIQAIKKIDPDMAKQLIAHNKKEDKKGAKK